MIRSVFFVSAAAELANPSSPDLFHLPSLTLINNRFVNFPGDGCELQVNTGLVGTYTHTGNTVGSPSPTPTPGPYKEIPALIPGNVYASNYYLGGQGSGYQDSIGANRGVYRADGVDLKVSSDTSVGTGSVLGWRTTGEWTNYTVNVAQRLNMPYLHE